jgi:hypothetical protein
LLLILASRKIDNYNHLFFPIFSQYEVEKIMGTCHFFYMPTSAIIGKIDLFYWEAIYFPNNLNVLRSLDCRPYVSSQGFQLGMAACWGKNGKPWPAKKGKIGQRSQPLT